MIRKIIQIDEELCNGCGACANACHEGAIQMIDGKAKLIRDDYCDGLGNCLPACPTGAITFVEREAAAYDEKAVEEHQKRLEEQKHRASERPVFQGCRDHGCARWHRRSRKRKGNGYRYDGICKIPSGQWPCQIKLVPVNAPYFNGAKLLIAADCTAYAYANMHEEFMRGKITIIGCPKLDDIDYSEKLQQIIEHNDIQSVTVVRMEVPCCGGLEHAAVTALKNSGKFIPWQVVTISIDGKILD